MRMRRVPNRMVGTLLKPGPMGAGNGTPRNRSHAGAGIGRHAPRGWRSRANGSPGGIGLHTLASSLRSVKWTADGAPDDGTFARLYHRLRTASRSRLASNAWLDALRFNILIESAIGERKTTGWGMARRTPFSPTEAGTVGLHDQPAGGLRMRWAALAESSKDRRSQSIVVLFLLPAKKERIMEAIQSQFDELQQFPRLPEDRRAMVLETRRREEAWAGVAEPAGCCLAGRRD